MPLLIGMGWSEDPFAVAVDAQPPLRLAPVRQRQERHLDRVGWRDEDHEIVVDP
jgi:hypothetical protein